MMFVTRQMILHSRTIVGALFLLATTLASLARVAVAQSQQGRANPPNFIVIQPDDYYFFQEWSPPAQFDGGQTLRSFPRNSGGLPNINRIRSGGLQLTSAYAASTMCGTSRYSTITGRYASRSSYGRALDVRDELRDVRIPSTKLEDARGVADANDCSQHNIAALLQQNGYRTGVVGKWHLAMQDGGGYSYSYDRIRQDVRACGFDYAEAIYKENMSGTWDGAVTHNMEHVTSRGIQFIESAVGAGQPFFLYFNPTIPHPSADVTDALRNADCRVTLEGNLPQAPSIPYGMPADYGGDCRAYRQSVLNRGGAGDDKMAGAVWVDDAIGSLFGALESLGELDNTFILFQLDHGVTGTGTQNEPGKGTLFEAGSRIVQFVHYPDRIARGSTFDGLVSTIDVAATIADVAGVGGVYPMDGKSWMPEIAGGNRGWRPGNDRCLFVEEGFDRSVRCGCYKYISIHNRQGSETARRARVAMNADNYYDLCDATTRSYLVAPQLSPERLSGGVDGSIMSGLKEKMQCHLRRTDPSGRPDYFDTTCDEPLGGLGGGIGGGGGGAVQIIAATATASPTLRRTTILPWNRPTYPQTNSPTLRPTNPTWNRPTYQQTNSPTLRPTNPTWQWPTYQQTNSPTLRPTNPTWQWPTYQQTSSPTDNHNNNNNNNPTVARSPPAPSTTQPTYSPTVFQPAWYEYWPYYQTNSPTHSYNRNPNPTAASPSPSPAPSTMQPAMRRPSLLPPRRHYTHDFAATYEPTYLEVNSTGVESIPEDPEDYCSDDQDYLFNGISERDCPWVIANDRCDRADPETALHIGENFCRESCSFCSSEGDDGCYDNPNLLWYGEEGKDCAWIAANNRCDRVRDDVEGTVVHVGEHYCPESCAYC